MRDDLHPFDGSADQTPLTPELEALERRLLLDAAQWDAESPDTGTLAAYALALANDPSAAVVTDGKVFTGPAPAPRAPRLSPFVPRQPSTWAAYIVTLAVVAAMALVLLWPSLMPHKPAINSPTPTASATTTALPTGTPAASPTRTIVGSGAGFTVTHVIPTLDPLTTSYQGADWLSTDPTTLTSSVCAQTVTVDLDFTFDVSNKVNRGWITFRWRNSEGFVSDPIQFPFAGADGSPVIYRQWDFPAIHANGAKWVDVEVLEPNPITARLNFQATCQFSVLSENISVSPAAYNCAAGGDQTFTFTGSIVASYAPGSHTVTYHWWRSDLTVVPDQSVTFGEGVGSVSAQPNQWIVHQTDVGPGKSASEQLVITSGNGGSPSGVSMSLSCP
jgi:hypothetical protein